MAEAVQTIQKFSLKVGENVVEMPLGAKVLSVQCQQNREAFGPDWTIQLWMLVCPSNTVEDRVFCVFGLGHELAHPEANPYEYIGAFERSQDDFIGHVFELRQNPERRHLHYRTIAPDKGSTE